MRLDPEDMLDAFQARVAEQTEQALRLSAELEQSEVAVRSPGGEVSVRVNSAGGLADLTLHPEADNMSRGELAALIVATSRRAQTALTAQVQELVSNLYGPDSDTAAFITEAYSSRYPALDDEETR